MTLYQLCKNLENVLNVKDFKADVSLNGLQVGDAGKSVQKVAFAVDACMETISGAIEQKADLLVVHHGLFWGKPIAITGTHYSRIKAMLDNDLALFACHLPLDAHPQLGNNAQIAKKLGLTDIEDFGLYHGMKIGFKGRFAEPLSNLQIIEKLGIRTSPHNVVISGGKSMNETVGIISGGAPDDVIGAIEENLDLFITGEDTHVVYHNCMEEHINMLCLGHYETEIFGVKALSEYVKQTYNLDTCFIDVPTGL